jgi:UDP-N-acetylmuramate--alanine ligase
MPDDGHVYAHYDCPRTRRLCQGIRGTCHTFGLHRDAQWRATDLRHRRGAYSFALRFWGRHVCDVALQVPGRHNVVNALGAAALAANVGASPNAIRAGLEQFSGLHRRLEVVHDSAILAIVDDYAHHPTEVTASLAAVRLRYPGRRICCVFQPHQASRTRSLLDEFARSLHNADTLAVADIYQTREDPLARRLVNAADLARQARALGSDVLDVHEPAEIRDRLLNDVLRPCDVLVTMGAGDIGRIAHAIAERVGDIRAAA